MSHNYNFDGFHYIIVYENSQQKMRFFYVFYVNYFMNNLSYLNYVFLVKLTALETIYFFMIKQQKKAYTLLYRLIILITYCLIIIFLFSI